MMPVFFIFFIIIYPPADGVKKKKTSMLTTLPRIFIHVVWHLTSACWASWYCHHVFPFAFRVRVGTTYPNTWVRRQYRYIFFRAVRENTAQAPHCANTIPAPPCRPPACVLQPRTCALRTHSTSTDVIFSFVWAMMLKFVPQSSAKRFTIHRCPMAFAGVNAYTTNWKPVSGTKLLGFSTGRGLGEVNPTRCDSPYQSDDTREGGFKMPKKRINQN